MVNKVLMHPSAPSPEVLFLQLECSGAAAEIFKIDVRGFVQDWHPGIDGINLRIELTSDDPAIVPAEYQDIAKALDAVARKGPKTKPNINRLSIKHETAISQYSLRCAGVPGVIRFSSAAKNTVLVVSDWEVQFRWVVDAIIPAADLIHLIEMKSEDCVGITIENIQADLFDLFKSGIDEAEVRFE